MLDIAWPELVVIGAVALVAIGPKDLPRVMQVLGRWVGKARTVANEFHRTFEQLEYESQIAEKLKQQKSAASETQTAAPQPDSTTPPPPRPRDEER
ncbi:MAG: Sec-independent protein translocase protein TatB [Bdellovibrionales bacterium]